MDKLDQAIAVLKAENKRLENELKAVRAAIAALQTGGRNSHGRIDVCISATKDRCGSKDAVGEVESKA